MKTLQAVSEIIAKRGGIRLDIGCGENKQGGAEGGWVGMDARPLPGVDIVQNVTRFPWPLPDECVTVAIASHLVEHIPPHMGDPRVQPLIDLLVANHIIDPRDVANFLGDYQDAPIFLRFMNEVWRVMKPGGEFVIIMPHGNSQGFLQDPTHIAARNEATWAYFDPEEPRTHGMLWSIYKPNPWQIKQLTWSPDANIEVVLVKRAMKGEWERV